MHKDRILVVGAGGQIGSVLTEALRLRYGADRVIATDIRPLHDPSGPSAILDALDRAALDAACAQYNVTQIYHLAAILSATGEKDPMRAWDINMNGLFNVLEIARLRQLDKVYFPSSIAVFGSNARHDGTPQNENLTPETVYGISKAAGENWCNYYHKRYGLDVRSLRYPGIVGYQSPPGGGTTDYAVDIYHYAVADKPYVCFLKPDARLPMMYMDDAIRATIEIMEAPAEQIRIRTSYNISAISFTPAEIAASIQRLRPGFRVDYAPDFRQQIAESWPARIDDSAARADWGWNHRFDLDAMTDDMLAHLGDGGK